MKANVIPNGAAVIMVFFGGCATLAGPLLASAADSGMVGLRDGAITAAALGVPLLAAGIVFLVGPGNTRVYDKDANRLARSSVRLTPGGLTF